MDALLSAQKWLPLNGPQREAYESPADVIYYGGAAGGGKTDLLIGLALTQHTRSIIFRREAKQLQGIYDRCAEILKTRDGFNGHDGIWRLPDGRQMEFGSCKDEGSEVAYQGRPHDLKAFDEIPHFSEKQFRFLCGWKRSTRKGQRQRVVCAGNPPTDSDGEWVIRYWAPWLQENHPRPAKSGELRWFAALDGKDIEVDGPEPVEHDGEWILPHSRTFIRSKVQDNPFLMETGYEQTLQGLPEPLRSQMLRGDFMAGRDDDPWQVVPTEWVRQAQARWQARDRKGVMDSVGVDVARGGKDYTVIARRHGNWYDTLDELAGSVTPDGPTVSGMVLARTRDGAPIHVDVIGVGSSVFDFLKVAGVEVQGINGAEKSEATDTSGKLSFFNKRAELHWKFRELLDPVSDMGIALPPGDGLKSDLCAPRWKMTPRGIQVESKEEIIKRIGRSPDRGDAVVLAAITTRKGWNKPIAIKRKPLV
jgi:Terminase large subunit, T4likevirus-type, N-terminal